MLTLNRLFFAMAFLGSSAAIQAADGTSNFAGFALGKNNEKPKSSADLRTTEYHYYPTYENVSGTHNGVQLNQAILLGSFDPRRPSNFIF